MPNGGQVDPWEQQPVQNADPWEVGGAAASPQLSAEQQAAQRGAQGLISPAGLQPRPTAGLGSLQPARITPSVPSEASAGDVGSLFQQGYNPVRVGENLVYKPPIDPTTLVNLPFATEGLTSVPGMVREAGGILPAIRTVGSSLGRGLFRMGAGSAIGATTGGAIGTIVGSPKQGAEIGAGVGAGVGPFLPNRLLARTGIGQMLLSNEELAAERTAQKVAQRTSDVLAGLRQPPTERISGPFGSEAAMYQQEPTETVPTIKTRPSPPRESILPGEYRGQAASARYPTTVPASPMPVPKGGVGAFPQITPPAEPPVSPPRPSPPRERILPGEYKGPAASARYPTTVPVSPTPQGGGAGAGGGRGPASVAGLGGRVGSAGDLASASEENLWAQYMKERLAVERGEPGADPNLRDAYANEIARRSQVKATGGQVRADVALPGIPGRQAGAVPKIEPQPAPATAPPAAPAAGDPVVAKFTLGEDLSTEELLHVSNVLTSEMGPGPARQAMGEYTRSIKRMGGAKSK